jgi:hypothetical protein
MAADIRKECRLDAAISDDNDSDGPSPEKQNEDGLFSLTWTRLSKSAESGTFRHVEAAEIHGSLEITVPYVIFWGPYQGGEVSKVLTASFMQKSVFK